MKVGTQPDLSDIIETLFTKGTQPVTMIVTVPKWMSKKCDREGWSSLRLLHEIEKHDKKKRSKK